MHRLTGFYLYNSNRLEKLLEKAVEVLDSMLCGDPLAPRDIVVQSGGMGRWLSLQIALMKGINANIVNLTVEKYLQKFASAMPGMDESDVYDPLNLRWTIYGILNDAPKSRYRELSSYISGDPLKRMLISVKLADLFDQYTVYRYDMISRWKEGKTANRGDRDETWQKELFMEMSGRFPGICDRAEFLEKFIRKCDGPVNIPDEMKGGVILFGISTMSEYHLRMFKAVSRHIPVHLFFMNPCREHWGDIVSTRKSEMFRMLDQDELHYESPNRFLADLGMSGRVFFLSLHETDVLDEDIFESPDDQKLSMLQCIQKEILDMNEEEAFELDDSIKINGCWGRTREMEVLKDELLRIFSADSDIRPHDVVVITPDIEEYAPYIEAVFGSGEKGPVIPFTVADRSARTDGKTVDAFLRILDLIDSDFLKTDILSIFEIEQIYKKFGMTRADLDTVRTAVESSGIKWGIDRRFREIKGAPPFEQNTWKFGFDRMLLGYSMPGGGVETFGQVMPFDEIEGQSARTIARFITFCEMLFRTWNSFCMERSLSDWAARLSGLVDELFIDESDTAEEIRFLRKIFDSLKIEERQSGISCSVGIRVIKSVLEDKIALNGFNRGFMNGSVTFCSIKPLRSIPFKVVCMAGMNDDVFPRDPKSTGFDLIRKHPALQDRNAKNSDRYFFLESLLSARKYFIISYNARNVRDSSFNICSSPVRLLSDYLSQKTCKGGRKNVFRETVHPLQPFSEKYFLKSSPLFTFSEKDYLAYCSFRAGTVNPPAEISARIQLPVKGDVSIELEDMISFFMNPPKYFLTKIAGVTVPYIKQEDPDSELFSIDPLSAFSFRSEYLEMHFSGLNSNDFKKRMRGFGRSPHGPAGKVLLDTVIREMEPYLSKVDGYRKKTAPEKVPFVVSINSSVGGLSVSGRFDSIYSDGQFFFKPAKNFSPRELIRWWIMHLLMNAADIKKSTYLCGLENDIEISPVKEPLMHLSSIAEVYFSGLSMPLPVTPFIIQNMNAELNRGETAGNAFAKMLEKKSSAWGGSEDDIPFRFTASMTGFYSGRADVANLVADISMKVSGAFEKYTKRSD